MHRVILRLEFKIQDMWIGVFWDLRGSDFHLWMCLVPCFPLHLVVREVK